PPLSLAGVVENRHPLRRLRDLPEPGRTRSEIGELGAQAAHPEAVVFGAIRAVDRADIRARIIFVRLESPRRRHTGVLSAFAPPPVVLARLGGVEVGELELRYVPDSPLRRMR